MGVRIVTDGAFGLWQHLARPGAPMRSRPRNMEAAMSGRTVLEYVKLDFIGEWEYYFDEFSFSEPDTCSFSCTGGDLVHTSPRDSGEREGHPVLFAQSESGRKSDACKHKQPAVHRERRSNR